ncbi:hypothetical protein GSI_02581 [Ganoderma sinense ZZ0214-1]|uniref:Uncharacterized protein n=1 Tax=Ganoderma sinense ZZ0214-1 TaxID=1077348 RepID=A0A2G8SM02_9APHY|nr:hypothetical protein GSI_02581 [Ganoderma sinense ZZ0214-1]
MVTEGGWTGGTVDRGAWIRLDHSWALRGRGKVLVVEVRRQRALPASKEAGEFVLRLELWVRLEKAGDCVEDLWLIGSEREPEHVGNVFELRLVLALERACECK